MACESVYRILPNRIRQGIRKESFDFDQVQEIRLRAGKPLTVLCNNREYKIDDLNGENLIVAYEEMKEMISYISNYSLYAYEQEMKQGFITIDGGHRIGLCGQAILEDGRIKNLKYISSINVRIAHEIIGCADKVLPDLIEKGEIKHTLIISPPGCGKTTLLRDIIRQISDGNKYIKGRTVGVVDERSEIGGCYRGVPQNHLGNRTDILDACPKAEGMLMLIRSMGPKVIAVDEIGSAADVQAIEYAIHCGCKMIATVHGISLEEIQKKPVLGQLISEKRFERYIVLGNRSSVGSVEGIYDENSRLLTDYRCNVACGSRQGNAAEKSV